MNSRLLIVMIFILTGCSSQRIWIVKSDEKGGVIGYSGYEGMAYEFFEKDLNNLVQCPNAVKLKEWQRKSHTSQQSFIVPIQNNSQTVSSSTYRINDQYNQNLLNVKGNEVSNTTSTIYNVIPVTTTDNWIEQRYICDWNKIKQDKYNKLSDLEKIDYHKNECSKNDFYSCMVLVHHYHKTNSLDQAFLYGEKVCLSEDSLEGPSGCNYLATKYSMDNNIEMQKHYLKKGCDIAKLNIDKVSTEGKKSCTFYGAFNQNENDFSVGLIYMLDQCAKNKKDCYNLACAYSIKNDATKALKYLKLSLEGGFEDISHLEKDPDLQNVRKTKEYVDLIKKYKTQNDEFIREITSEEKESLNDLLITDGCNPQPGKPCISVTEKKIQKKPATKEEIKQELFRKKQEKDLKDKLLKAFEKNP